MTEKAPMEEARRIWEAAAPGWAKWEGALSAELTGATEAMIDMAEVERGMRALDVACGAGVQSIRLAERVGPEGRVVATDISATMLEHVRDNAARAGCRNIETLECAAERLDAASGPFDAAICRFGLMLFPAPRRALEAARRVLRRGARFSALVFTTPPRNPFMAEPMRILLRHAGKEPPGPGRPGIFALGAEGRLAGLMEESGLGDVRSRIVAARLRLPGASAALSMMQEALGAYRAVVADLGPEERARAWDEVRESLKRFETGGGFEASLEFAIASGAKPA